MNTATEKASRKRRQYLPAEERRQRILESAREVFAQSGLQGARTRELAQAAGINQATLFEHFKSKEALFVAAVVQPLVELMTGARERADRYAEADSPEAFADYLQQSVREHLDRLIDVFPLLVQALFSDQTLGHKLYRDHIVPALEAQADTIEPFVTGGMEPRLVQLASFGMFFAVAMDRAMLGSEADLGAISQQLSQLISTGSTRGVAGTALNDSKR